MNSADQDTCTAEKEDGAADLPAAVVAVVVVDAAMQESLCVRFNEFGCCSHHRGGKPNEWPCDPSFKVGRDKSQFRTGAIKATKPRTVVDDKPRHQAVQAKSRHSKREREASLWSVPSGATNHTHRIILSVGAK